MTVFEKAMVTLLKHEGEYSNDTRDNGGETYRGVSRRWYPKWGGWGIIDRYDDKTQLSEDEALSRMVNDFYYTYYWVKIRADAIDDKFVAQMLFNFAVNVGKRKAIQKAQRILGTKVDGVVGPQTVNALNSVNADTFVYHYLLEIIDFYMVIGKDQPHFLRGWLNRAMSCFYQYENEKR